MNFHACQHSLRSCGGLAQDAKPEKEDEEKVCSGMVVCVCMCLCVYTQQEWHEIYNQI